jgi:hypothetical protein
MVSTSANQSVVVDHNYSIFGDIRPSDLSQAKRKYGQQPQQDLWHIRWHIESRHL